MQRDMHYFGTYAMARAAGIRPEDCQIIATAAEFVDDNGKRFEARFSDGGLLAFVPTAHHSVDRDNLDEADQRQVWVPFHFLPGNEGETLSQRLVCRKDSEIARELVAHNIGRAGEDFGPYLAGITAHVYGDTFSHYSFSGVSSRSNEVESELVVPINAEGVMESDLKGEIEGFVAKYGFEVKFPNFKKEVWREIGEYTSDFIEGTTGALGHGGVYTFPDKPFLVWEVQFAGGLKETRNNPDTFLEGCEKLYAMFQRFLEKRPGARGDKGRPFDEIREAVKEILAVQADRDGRAAAWEEAAAAGRLFLSHEPILPYRGEEWKEQRERLHKSENSQDVLETDIFRFYQAASLHRIYVLRDLLPRHGLVVH